METCGVWNVVFCGVFKRMFMDVVGVFGMSGGAERRFRCRIAGLGIIFSGQSHFRLSKKIAKYEKEIQKRHLTTNARCSCRASMDGKISTSITSFKL